MRVQTMHKALLFILIGYAVLSSVVIIHTHRMLRMPIPFNPAFYLHDVRRGELLEIADYMRARGIDIAFPSSERSDPALEAMMKRHRLSKIEFKDDGVVLFGAWLGRTWFDYYYGENSALHVNALKARFPDRTYFQIDDHWYFVSTRGKTGTF